MLPGRGCSSMAEQQLPKQPYTIPRAFLIVPHADRKLLKLQEFSYYDWFGTLSLNLTVTHSI